jgi:hypothetical protein
MNPKNDVHTPESIHDMCIHRSNVKNVFYENKFTLDEVKLVLTYDTDGIGPNFIKRQQPHLELDDIKKLC